MTYTYTCDGWCDGDHHEERPAITAEFNQEWFRTTVEAGRVAQEYDEGELVTLCGPCTERLLIKE